MPTTMVMALDPHPDIAGMASSLGGTLQMVTGGAMMAVAGQFFDGTAVPMLGVIAAAGLLAAGTALLTFRRGMRAGGVGVIRFRLKTSASKVYGGSFDAHSMHNVCTTHMPAKSQD